MFSMSLTNAQTCVHLVQINSKKHWVQRHHSPRGCFPQKLHSTHSPLKDGMEKRKGGKGKFYNACLPACDVSMVKSKPWISALTALIKAVVSGSGREEGWFYQWFNESSKLSFSTHRSLHLSILLVYHCSLSFFEILQISERKRAHTCSF